MSISYFPPLGSGTTPVYVSFGGTNVDAFGRLRASNPFTLFDSQNRYAKDPQFSEALTGSATATFASNESTVDLNLTTASNGFIARGSG